MLYGLPALHSVVATRLVSGHVDFDAGGRTARNLRGSKSLQNGRALHRRQLKGEGGSQAAGGCAVVLRSCLEATRAYACSVSGGRGGSAKVARGLLEGAPSCSGTARKRRALTRAVGAEGVQLASRLHGNICVATFAVAQSCGGCRIELGVLRLRSDARLRALCWRGGRGGSSSVARELLGLRLESRS